MQRLVVGHSAKPCILVAASRKSSHIVARCLDGFAELHYVFTIEEALVRLAQGGIHAIVAGLHFDDSLMPVLLDKVKSNPATRDLPFHCCRFLPSCLNPAAMAAVHRACRELTQLDLIDLPEWHARYGWEAAAERFRAVIASRLPP
ncbi:MAG TPA: hypothetical protein VFZ84_04460 [Burkholderiales bacterium]